MFTSKHVATAASVMEKLAKSPKTVGLANKLALSIGSGKLRKAKAFIAAVEKYGAEKVAKALVVAAKKAKSKKKPSKKKTKGKKKVSRGNSLLGKHFKAPAKVR